MFLKQERPEIDYFERKKSMVVTEKHLYSCKKYKYVFNVETKTFFCG